MSGSSLIGAPLSTRSLTFFGLGGSGIRTLEPLLYLCALGLGPRELNVVLIDPDQSNAAVARSRMLLELYIRTRTALIDGQATPDGYFRTEVKDVLGKEALWSPIEDGNGGSDEFSVQAGEPLMTGAATMLGRMFDLLYEEPLQRMHLNLGFRGVPSIGTVFMNRLREQPFFETILTNAKADNDSRFFAAGSIFGGTGASGLPVVGRSLADGIDRDETRNKLSGVDRSRLGAALLLPYFTLPAPDQRDADDGGIRPETALFMQNAAAALPLYFEDNAGFSTYYVLGDNNPREQKKNVVGGEFQDNASHYIELFAALAALDFAANEESNHDGPPVFHAMGAAGTNVQWQDLPIDDKTRQRLMGGLVAMHTFLSIFRPEGNSHPNLAQTLQGVTWVSELGLGEDDFQAHSEAFDRLGGFFRRTWDWLTELAQSNPSLALLSKHTGKPTSVPLDQSIFGRRAANPSLRKTVPGGFEVFRHWNMAAHVRRGNGYGGFLDVMRAGSEAFAAERFSETINV